jgi:hypothetical protein
VREEEERRQRAENEREARLREDRLRLEEAERRARVEGELKLKQQLLLEEQRQRHTHGRRFGRSVWVATAAGIALFVAIGGGLAAWASQQHQAEKKALARENRAGAGGAAGLRREDTRPRREGSPRYCRGEERERPSTDPERAPASEARPRSRSAEGTSPDRASDAAHRPVKSPLACASEARDKG